MATADPFSVAAAASVADQLTAFFPGRDPVADGREAARAAADPELTETLAVCFLEARHVRQPAGDFTWLGRPSGVWHHQIRSAGVATHVARSQQSGFADAGRDVVVQQLAESPIAGKLDQALAWVDRKVKGRATVRLLVIPAYCVHALLVDRSGTYSVVLADQPANYSHLAYEQEYPLTAFLKLLGKERFATSFTE